MLAKSIHHIRQALVLLSRGGQLLLALVQLIEDLVVQQLDVVCPTVTEDSGTRHGLNVSHDINTLADKSARFERRQL